MSMTLDAPATLGDTRPLRDKLLAGGTRCPLAIDLEENYGIEGGGPATIRKLSGRERGELLAAIESLGDGKAASIKGYAAVVAVGLGDANGAAVFSLSDVDQINDQMGSDVLRELGDDILDFNGMSGASREAAEKNSEAEEMNGSGTL